MSGNQGWETPWPLFASLDEEFDFTLDGAASRENAKVCRWLAEDGLTWDEGRTWLERGAFGYGAIPHDRIFVNPPYADLGPWVELFRDWSAAGATVVALLLNSMSPEWFRQAWRTADEIRLIYPRVNFLGTTSSNTKDSLVVVWHPRAELRMWPPRVHPWMWSCPCGRVGCSRCPGERKGAAP